MPEATYISKFGEIMISRQNWRFSNGTLFQDIYYHIHDVLLKHYDNCDCKSPVSQQLFPWRCAVWTLWISSWVITTNCRLYSNISQILLLYKMWQYYNKFDSPKSLGVCYWCVKILQYRYMEHGLKHSTFYFQKHIEALAMCYNPALVRDKPLEVPAPVKLVYF